MNVKEKIVYLVLYHTPVVESGTPPQMIFFCVDPVDSLNN